MRHSPFPWRPSWCASRARFGFAGTCIHESDGEALRAWVQKRQQQLEAGLRSMWANDHAGTNQVQNKNPRPNQKAGKWRRGWDSNPEPPIKTRNLLISIAYQDARTARNAGVGYKRGTKNVSEGTRIIGCSRKSVLCPLLCPSFKSYRLPYSAPIPASFIPGTELDRTSTHTVRMAGRRRMRISQKQISLVGRWGSNLCPKITSLTITSRPNPDSTINPLIFSLTNSWQWRSNFVH